MMEPLNGGNGVYRFPISDDVLYTITEHKHTPLSATRFAVAVWVGERRLVQRFCGCFKTYVLACEKVDALTRNARAVKRAAGRARGEN